MLEMWLRVNNVRSVVGGQTKLEVWLGGKQC